MSECLAPRWNAHHFFYHGDLDVALRHFVRPAINELAAQRLIDSFFFVRYTLGGPHLRLRYRLAPDMPSSVNAIDQILQEAATRFLERWRSAADLDPEKIRQESRAILAAVPEKSELYYENNTLLPFPFEPEVDRYGGPGLLESSLDFFVISSAQTLETIRDPAWESLGRRGAMVLRLLLRQAWGFAESEKEFLRHLGYRLPVGQEIGDEIWSKADRDFESRREVYRALLKHELSLLEEAQSTMDEPVWPSASFLYQAAKRLSQAVRNENPDTRWQIGHSQLHMTSNRLGFFPFQEMHLQRILWRAAHDLKEADPATWRRFMTASFDREEVPRGPLHQLLVTVIDHLREQDPALNAENTNWFATGESMLDTKAPSAGHPGSAETYEISIHTILERRPGVDCAVQRRETTAALLTSWNELKGPLSIAPALEFVRDHQRFRVADLPRLRDEASRIVLARWLIREGFLRVGADQDAGQELPQRRATVARDEQKKGSLVIVGSGIKSLAQMTLEARSWLEKADVIFYLLADPASEVWIQKNYPDSIDLSRLYSEYFQRYAVYEAMVEAMMRPVREGKTVVSIYYGHPGVFVTPTHEAIKAARAEGYSARMLPGVSASDYLYADVGFNPSEAGIQFYEATDLLVYNRPLHPENNVVIWQIGLVGNPTSLDDYSKLPILIDYLYKFYDPDCEVAHYQGSVFSVCDSVVEWLPLRELGKGAKVTSMSTLYIPPQKKPQLDQDMVQRLGLIPVAPQSEEAGSVNSIKPRVYEGTPSRSALADFVVAAATDPDLLTRFERCPESVVDGAGLSEDERGALFTRMQGRIWAAIKNAATLEPATEERAAVLLRS